MNEGAPGIRDWAAMDGASPEERMSTLLPGDVDGTVRHPFRSVPREEYLATIAEAGSIAKLTHDAPIALINLSDIVGIQSTVNRERLVEHMSNPAFYPQGTRGAGHGGLVDRPIVVRKGGLLFLHDGHTRLTAASLRGQTTAKVRLIDLDGQNGTEETGDAPGALARRG
jgi:hypothetical protein